MGKTRDFTRPTVNEVWDIVCEIEKNSDTFFFDDVQDFFVKIKDWFTGDYNAANSIGNVKDYYEHVVDTNDINKKRYKKILNNVKYVDEDYSQRFTNIGNVQDAFAKKLEGLTNLISPEAITKPSDYYKNQLDDVNKTYEDAKVKNYNEIKQHQDNMIDLEEDHWYDYAIEGGGFLFNNLPGKIKDSGQGILGFARDVCEYKPTINTMFGEIELWNMSDVAAGLSKTQLGEDFMGLALNMDYIKDDSNNKIYTARKDCWQQYMGYNDMYDYAFQGFTSADKRKLDFNAGGQDYTLWMWKGDYYGLGAGGETGIYSGSGWHKDTCTDSKLKMTLEVTDKDNQKVINYSPSESQWWITGFNPEYQDKKCEDLKVRGKIDFTDEPEMWDGFYNKYKDGKKDVDMTFDEKNKVVYYTW